MKNLVLLGSTGSIGTQTLEILRAHAGYHALALCADKNVSLIEEQIREFKPEYAVMYNEEAANDLKDRIKDTSTEVLSGMDGLLQVCTDERADVVLTALVGMIGIRPTIAAIKSKKTIALANKETLVTAGHIIMP
ncbi:MAG: 1-deoxy-D-xylulose-5-phosphate reductoisomerase, partial [Lachnospiraceae bacterium]|nr:1-deoxy-D-xylulose-5-phosphate reductoisomerase [Lachnospiraceae bacterium]